LRFDLSHIGRTQSVGVHAHRCCGQPASPRVCAAAGSQHTTEEATGRDVSAPAQRLRAAPRCFLQSIIRCEPAVSATSHVAAAAGATAAAVVAAAVVAAVVVVPAMVMHHL
jgi:hypothetical protein